MSEPRIAPGRVRKVSPDVTFRSTVQGAVDPAPGIKSKLICTDGPGSERVGDLDGAVGGEFGVDFVGVGGSPPFQLRLDALGRAASAG